MRPRSWFLLMIVVFFCWALSGSTQDFLQSHHHILSSKRYDFGAFQAPARRTLLSDSKRGTETALVAALDGTVYLLDVGTLKPRWSFSSGPEIYSSYQAPVSDKENASGIGSSYFIDCGDDWELYAHNSLGKLKLMKSLEEYISSTPQIAEDGGIVLGAKKTTAFLVDAKTGRIIYTYGTLESPPTMQTSANDFPHNTTVKEQHQSGTDLKTNELPLYITRTDYKLTSFLPYSDKVLWNMTVAEIGAAFLCQDIEKSPGSPIPNESSEPDLPYDMPLPCQSRALVYRFRKHNVLGTLSMPKGLPKALQQDMMFSAATSHILPSQPNVEKVLKLLPSPHINDEFLGTHDNQGHKAVLNPSTSDENSGTSHAADLEMPSDKDFLFVVRKFGASLLLFGITVLVFAAYYCNLFSRIKVQLVSQSVATNSMSVHSKRKRSRKSEKVESNGDKHEIEEVNITRSESNNNFWLNLNQPISYGNDGRVIGKLFVSEKEIAKGSNGTIVLEGIYDGRSVAVKRLVRAYNDIAFKEIQNLIVSDRHPNIVRWYGVEQDLDFVYLALERCACSLNDLILMHAKSLRNPIQSMDEEVAAEFSTCLDSVKGPSQDIELWKSDGYPSPLLLNLMRTVISGVAHLHELGIIHRDLKPQNVLIINEKSLCAKLSDMGISRCLVGDVSSFSNHATGSGSSGWQAPEQLLHGRQTRAVDMFGLGCVLFFCITGGQHPFGNRLERDINIAKNKVDLFLVEQIPEALNLFTRLLDPNAEMRPKAQEVLFHPLFWSAKIRLDFLRDASDRVELEDRRNVSDLLNGLESIAPLALGTKWNEKMEPAFLNNIGRYRRYKFDSVRDLLRVMRNKLNHYRELPAEIQELVGSVPDGFDRYFTSRFPKLLIEVYKVMLAFCSGEEWFSKYCTNVQ